MQAVEAGATAAGLTTYQKAHLIFMLPHSVITVSLVTALLPELSRSAHAGKLVDVGRAVASASRNVAAVVVPIAAVLLVTAPSLTRVMFGFGTATADSAAATGNVVQVLVLGLLPFTLVYMLFRGWYAIEDTKSPFLVTLLINGVNLTIALAASALAPVGLKIEALALSYVIAYWVALLVAWPALRRRLGDLDSSATVRSLIRISVAAGSSAVLGWVTLHLLSATVDTAGHLALFGLLAILGVAMLGSYVVIGHRMHIREVTWAVDTVRRRLPF